MVMVFLEAVSVLEAVVVVLLPQPVSSVATMQKLSARADALRNVLFISFPLFSTN
jgi:hypothetical protein